MSRYIGVAMAAAVILAPLAAGADTAQPAPSSDVCVDVTIGASHAGNLDCLNQRLRQKVAVEKQQAEQIGELQGTATKAPPTELNLFNQTATQERLGDAFGHSVVPQRPVRTFPNPLTNGK